MQKIKCIFQSEKQYSKPLLNQLQKLGHHIDHVISHNKALINYCHHHNISLLPSIPKRHKTTQYIIITNPISIEQFTNANKVYLIPYVNKAVANKVTTKKATLVWYVIIKDKILKLCHKKCILDKKPGSIDIQSESLLGSFTWVLNILSQLTKIAELADLAQETYSLDKLSSLINNNLFSFNTDFVLQTYNKNDKFNSKSKTITALFEEQVRLYPKNIALVINEQPLSYSQLNKKANQLARYLRKQYKAQTQREIQPSSLIALCIERGFDMMIAILGVLKTGAAYVPIDPTYPENRILYMLYDCKTNILITQSHLHRKMLKLSTPLRTKRYHINGLLNVLAIDASKTSKALDAISTRNLNKNNQADELAYVMYTSGTTGKPKGVMVRHDSVTKFIIDNSYCQFDGNTRTFGVSNYAFDASIFDIFGTLLNGGRLYLLEKSQIFDMDLLVKHAEHYKVNTIFVTTVLFNQLVEYALPMLQQFKYILFGGERANVNSIQKFLAQGYKTKLVQVYGPTETTVFTTYYPFRRNEDIQIAPIGKAIKNRKLYILNEDLQSTPVGEIGELYISGAGVARGYLGLPELTEEHFIHNYFATKADLAKGYTRLYKTGDLVRLLNDGNIEFIGRNDLQVKIHGFRVELEEIEKHLDKINEIKQVCVVAKDCDKNTNNQDRYLVVYYCADKMISGDSIKKYLSKSLPDYMLPSIYIHLVKMPLTENGKIDRKSLPEPVMQEGKIKLVKPRDQLEQQITQVWQQALHRKQVGINEDFFQSGGNSIMVIRITSQLNKTLQINLRAADIFTHSNIKQLAQLIRLIDQYHYRPLTLLNQHEKDKQALWMIHPGGAGCEVYQPLANQLNAEYNCYGVENYNLYHEEKIADLQRLAEYYLKQLLRHEAFDKNSICLLGWSLGGQIALEMAAQLEQQGYQNIKVYLLDTLISDQVMEKYHKLLENEHTATKRLRTMMQEQGIHEEHINDYIERVVAANPAEHKLFIMPISQRLTNTKITLFKAIEADDLQQDDTTQALSQHCIDTVNNNLEKITAHYTTIRLHCSHSTILQHTDKLLEMLLKDKIKNHH